MNHELTPAPAGPQLQHVFIAGRCTHCGCDDHSLPEPGEQLATWEQPCPVAGPERRTQWTFGPDERTEVEG